MIEVVVVTALIVTALFGFAQAGSVAVRMLRSAENNLQATLLAEEALEAVRSARDESWAGHIAWRTQSPLASPSLRYYPTVVAGAWSLATTSPGPVNGIYDRYVIFERVSRDSSDRIVSSGGTDDPGTRKVTAVASGNSQTVSLVSFIADFQSYLGLPTESKVISFEDATTDTNLDVFPSDNAGDGDPAQGFTTLDAAISVSKAELLVRRATASPSDVYVEIRTTPTGTVLGTSQMINAATLLDTRPVWAAFRFFNPVALAAGTKYYVRLRSIPASTNSGSGSRGAIYWDYLQTPSSPYAGGEARRFIGKLSNPNDAGQSLDQYDYGFRIYAIQ